MEWKDQRYRESRSTIMLTYVDSLQGKLTN